MCLKLVLRKLKKELKQRYFDEKSIYINKYNLIRIIHR